MRDIGKVGLGKDGMWYKGYFGSYEISLVDNCLYGKILHTTDLISYEAKTVQGLKTHFMKAVDDYIQTLKELQKAPQ